MWASQIVQCVKNSPAIQKTLETQVPSLGWEDPLEEEMASHSSILAWRIPWMDEPGALWSMGLQRVGHNWARMHAHSLLGSKLRYLALFEEGNHQPNKASGQKDDSWMLSVFTAVKHLPSSSKGHGFLNHGRGPLRVQWFGRYRDEAH